MDHGYSGSDSQNKPRAIFFGTPEFAVPCLRALIEVAEVALVVTQPDRPAGRGMKLAPTPVKALAETERIPVIQPAKVRAAQFAEHLRAQRAEVGVVVAYGRILPLSALQAPRLGCVNVHASLLPKYRGSAPIHWSIIRGETETGVCLMQMDEGMDTGPVLAFRKTGIGPEETAGELSGRLSQLGAELIREQLTRFLRGELPPIAQDHARSTAAPRLRKEDGLVRWNSAARKIHDLVRGLNPWPGAHCWIEDRRIKLHRTHVVTESGETCDPGTVIRADGCGLEVACSEGVLGIDEMQPEGRRRMSVEQFLAGYGLKKGSRFATKES